MAYEKVGWKDYPDKTTPTSAANLNKMDEGIANNDKNIGDMSKISDIGDGTTAGAIAKLKERIAELEEENSELNSKFSHVGMIIHSTTLDTMEKVINIYGGTKWVKIEGRFLLGQSSSYAINSLGGSATHTLTVNEMPSHRHSIAAYGGGFYVSGSGTTANTDNVAKMNTDYAGGSQPHNNMPPYKAVYIWERTA